MDIQLIKNCDLTKYTTMRVRAFGDLMIVKSVDTLKELLRNLKNENQSYRVLGWGANQILPLKAKVPYIKLSFDYNLDELNHNLPSYILPASVPLGKLTSIAMRRGLKGWEVFTGIPASLGGAVFMNAGTNLGEIGPLIKRVWLITHDGNEKIIDCDSRSFSYRQNNFTQPGDIIYQVEIMNLGESAHVIEVIKNYLALRKKTQPLKEATCGCVFKNSPTCRAGKIVDIIGLKGFTYKGLKVSHLHGNFIENLGFVTGEATGVASGDDAYVFIENIKKEILLNTGIDFKLEVRID